MNLTWYNIWNTILICCLYIFKISFFLITNDKMRFWHFYWQFLLFFIGERISLMSNQSTFGTRGIVRNICSKIEMGRSQICFESIHLLILCQLISKWSPTCHYLRHLSSIDRFKFEEISIARRGLSNWKITLSQLYTICYWSYSVPVIYTSTLFIVSFHGKGLFITS